MEGNWKAVKKENIKSIEEKLQPALLSIKIKSLSKKDLLKLAKAFGYLFTVMFFLYTAVEGFDKFSTGLLALGLLLMIIEKYFNKPN